MNRLIIQICSATRRIRNIKYPSVICDARQPVAYLEIQNGGPQGSAGRSPPVGSRGEAPLGGLGDFVPRSWSILKEINRNFYAKIELKCCTFKKFCSSHFFLTTL
jgi:hypothetical protein